MTPGDLIWSRYDRASLEIKKKLVQLKLSGDGGGEV